jgi:geranylgeranyl reductase family protein
MKTDILVIGAGPSGLIAARDASQAGAKVTVFEKKKEIGIPCHCAGLLSLKGMEKIGLATRGPYVRNKVKGAHFYSPSGLTFTIEKKSPVACVVDRDLIDKNLAQQAKKAGANINLSSNIYDLKRTKNGICSIGKHESVFSKLIINAEGAPSKFLKTFGLKPINFSYVLPGLQFDLKGINVDPDFVEVHISRKIAPNFFAWVIPLGKDSVRVGLACKGMMKKELLEIFIKKRFRNKEKIEHIKIQSGLVVTSGPIEKTFNDNFLVIGDAAGQVKPTTGGGVILGGICASIAGSIAAEAVNDDNFKKSFLKKYEKLWRKKLGKEFKTTFFARRILNHLSDKAVDKLFDLIIKKNLQENFQIFGDMDFQRKTILKLFKEKEVFSILPTILGLSLFK